MGQYMWPPNFEGFREVPGLIFLDFPFYFRAFYHTCLS
jgi:hypothetical protein